MERRCVTLPEKIVKNDGHLVIPLNDRAMAALERLNAVWKYPTNVFL